MLCCLSTAAKALGTVVKKSFRTINQKFSSYLAGLFEGDGCI